MFVPPWSAFIYSILPKATCLVLSLYSSMFPPSCCSHVNFDPKLRIEKRQPYGKLRTKIVKASLAVSIRLKLFMLPLRSTRKIKWNLSLSTNSVISGSSLITTLRSYWSCYGAGSKLGTREATQAISLVFVFFAKTRWGSSSMSAVRQYRLIFLARWLLSISILVSASSRDTT